MSDNVKEQIIKIVAGMKEQIGTDVMGMLFDRENGSNSKIGSNQFRNIASICNKADSYEELELMIQYNIAKANDRESWKKKCKNQKSFGKNILEAMEKVRAISSDKCNDLEKMELFFGYLFWQVRVWADTYGNKQTDDKKDNFPRSNNNSSSKHSNNFQKKPYRK